MPKIHVSRSKVIDASIHTVFKTVANLEEWEAWSPWLIMEPDAEVTVAEDGQSYHSQGTRVGEGQMTLVDTTEDAAARYDLTFLKPFKSTAKVGMDLCAVEGGTEVTWTMDSQLPFFMFFMKRMMEAFIGMDYERGLNLLKDYVEDGEVHSQLNFLDPRDYAGCDYVGIRRTCTLNDMPSLVQQDFERLAPWAAQTCLNPAEMFCIYHKCDPAKGHCNYTAAVPFEDKPDNIPTDFIIGSQPPTRLYTLEHVGPYEHLGNAWSTLHSMIRAKEIKVIKGYHPFETYGNSPQDTEPNKLITHINFAIK